MRPKIGTRMPLKMESAPLNTCVACLVDGVIYLNFCAVARRQHEVADEREHRRVVARDPVEDVVRGEHHEVHRREATPVHEPLRVVISQRRANVESIPATTIPAFTPSFSSSLSLPMFFWRVDRKGKQLSGHDAR